MYDLKIVRKPNGNETLWHRFRTSYVADWSEWKPVRVEIEKRRDNEEPEDLSEIKYTIDLNNMESFVEWLSTNYGDKHYRVSGSAKKKEYKLGGNELYDGDVVTLFEYDVEKKRYMRWSLLETDRPEVPTSTFVKSKQLKSSSQSDLAKMVNWLNNNSVVSYVGYSIGSVADININGISLGVRDWVVINQVDDDEPTVTVLTNKEYRASQGLTPDDPIDEPIEVITPDSTITPDDEMDDDEMDDRFDVVTPDDDETDDRFDVVTSDDESDDRFDVVTPDDDQITPDSAIDVI